VPVFFLFRPLHFCSHLVAVTAIVFPGSFEPARSDFFRLPPPPYAPQPSPPPPVSPPPPDFLCSSSRSPLGPACLQFRKDCFPFRHPCFLPFQDPSLRKELRIRLFWQPFASARVPLWSRPFLCRRSSRSSLHVIPSGNHSSPCSPMRRPPP